MRASAAITTACALVLLGGCASIDAQQSHTSSVITDAIPKWAGGEPASTPPRPAEAAAFPYVNAAPPQRAEKPLTEDEQKKLTADLDAARKRVQAKAAENPDAPEHREASPLARGKLAGEQKAPAISN